MSSLGAGSLGGIEIYGVIDDNFERSAIPDAVWLSLKIRKESLDAKDLIIVSDTGDGAYFALDTSRTNSANEHPIVEWWPGLPAAANNPSDVAEDFGSFLLQQVQRAC